MRIYGPIPKALLLAALLVPPGAGAAAQDTPERAPRPLIRVTGEATVSAKPDQAQIDIGVVTQAPTAQAAATQNAQQLEAVLAELRMALGPTANVKTTSYSLHPNYRYPREGGPPTITGYTATNVVQVRLDDLTGAGRVVDLAMKSGANQINRLQFTLKDEQPVRLEALRDAATKARSQAGALAAALGLKIVRVLSVAEGEPVVVRPIPVAAMRAAGAGAATPVEPGTIDVRATVTLEVEVAQ